MVDSIELSVGWRGDIRPGHYLLTCIALDVHRLIQECLTFSKRPSYLGVVQDILSEVSG